MEMEFLIACGVCTTVQSRTHINYKIYCDYCSSPLFNQQFSLMDEYIYITENAFKIMLLVR